MSELNNYQELYSAEGQNIQNPPEQSLLNTPVEKILAPPKEEIQYSGTEQVCAFLAMLAGFLFIRFTLYHEMGLFTTLFY